MNLKQITHSINQKMNNSDNVRWAVMLIELNGPLIDTYNLQNKLLNETRLLLASYGSTTQSFVISYNQILYINYDILFEAIIEKEATEIYSKIKKMFMDWHISFTQNIHIGVALYPDHGFSLEELVNHAKNAIDSRPNHPVTCYSLELKQELERQTNAEIEIKKAIPANRFVVHYQPQVNIQVGKLSGFEALIRMYSEKGQLIPPDAFIPVAENKHYLESIFDVLISSVSRELSLFEFKDQRYSIAINVSPNQLNNRNFIKAIRRALNENRVSPSMLEVEITESSLIHQFSSTLRMLTELRELGIHIALDDFGTGYSSLNYLTQLPLDKVKIDKSFIKHIELKKHALVVENIIHLCHDLDYIVCVEGVEDKTTLDILHAMGADVIQGYYFSKPLPADAIQNYINHFNFPK